MYLARNMVYLLQIVVLSFQIDVFCLLARNIVHMPEIVQSYHFFILMYFVC